MGRSRIRIPVAVLSIFLLAMAATVLAVHVSAACEHFVRTYVTKPIRNRVSDATAQAWAKWRIAHPNWKPNPTLHRPKYVMTHEEAMQKVAFACSISVTPINADGLSSTDSLASIRFDAPPPMLDLPPMDATQITLTDATPPQIAEIALDNPGPPLAPFIPPILNSGPSGPPIVPPPPAAGPVPEPPSLLLLASGMLCLLLLPGIKFTRLPHRTRYNFGESDIDEEPFRDAIL